MADALHDFGAIDELKPEAIGIPGNRRFRVLFREGKRAACCWMEKEQLGALADAIKELLEQYEGGKNYKDPLATGIYPEPFQVEAQTGRLALGYNDESELFIIYLYDLESEQQAIDKATTQEEAEELANNILPIIRVEASRSQLEKFYREAAQVISSGRVQHSKNGHIPYQN
ncbi:DUF3090 family protein [Candidatus Chlorohelix sp.]|uniref:DUF3090 family protein n=1 Tax=Candidatus Chlorohelix sp. TaxID=3139201 RepID=UPI00302D0F2C